MNRLCEALDLFGEVRSGLDNGAAFSYDETTVQ